MRVAIVGCGTAGPAAALLLARDGHDVTIVERVAEPRPVGAGLLIQPIGQQILRELGVGDDLERLSTPVLRIDARNEHGRRVMDFGYGDLATDGAAAPLGWGVNRGVLFDLLWRTVAAAGIPTRTGIEVLGLEHDVGWWLGTEEGRRLGPYDLVIGADGARSGVRHLLRLASKDVGYAYGAVWAVVPDPDRLAGNRLTQFYRGCNTILGFLPTGVAEASIFWSVRSRDIDHLRAAGARAWQELARPLAGRLAPLVDRVTDAGLLPARYRDVVAPRPIALRGKRGAVLLGDAAHAMSPQLGLGANFALADAWTLACCLRGQPTNLPAALEDYVAQRRAHVRWYTWCSRLMTPLFQSDLAPLAVPRDWLLEPVARIAWVRRQFVTTLLGTRTSPWTQWMLPRMPPDPGTISRSGASLGADAGRPEVEQHDSIDS